MYEANFLMAEIWWLRCCGCDNFEINVFTTIYLDGDLSFVYPHGSSVLGGEGDIDPHLVLEVLLHLLLVEVKEEKESKERKKKPTASLQL